MLLECVKNYTTNLDILKTSEIMQSGITSLKDTVYYCASYPNLWWPKNSQASNSKITVCCPLTSTVT